MRRVALVISLIAAVVLAAGCGGGDGGTEPKAYASAVCGAITSWQQRLQTGAQTLGTSLSDQTDLKAVKGKLVEFMGGAVESTDKMLADVKAAGPPDIEDGEAFQTDLEKGLQQARDTFADAETSAKGLPTNDPTAFQQGATELGQTLEKQGTEIEDTLREVDQKHDSEELNKAFEDDPACKNL